MRELGYLAMEKHVNAATYLQSEWKGGKKLEIHAEKKSVDNRYIRFL